MIQKAISYITCQKGAKCASKQKIKNPKIGLCFLTTKNIAHLDVWKSWMEGYEDKVNIYVHYSPNHAKNITQCFLISRLIDETIPTKWGDVSLVKAEGLLYKAALKDRSVKSMILLSPSDVPVRSFEYIYNRLINAKTSYVSFMTQNDVEKEEGDSEPCLWFIKQQKCKELIQEFITNKPCESISQWKVLRRDDAKLFVMMLKNVKFVSLFSKECVYFRASGQAPDEFMFPLWINYILQRNGLKGSCLSFFKHVVTTHVEFKGKRVWSKRKKKFVIRPAAHPVQIKGMGPRRKDIICDNESMFMRKVDNISTRRLQSFLPLDC